MREYPFSSRLLKKVQMQGGAPILRMSTRGGVPTAGGSRRTPGTPQREPERAGYPSEGWVPADRLFSAACYSPGGNCQTGLLAGHTPCRVAWAPSKTR
jgi:hypothetical protein